MVSTSFFHGQEFAEKGAICAHLKRHMEHGFAPLDLNFFAGTHGWLIITTRNEAVTNTFAKDLGGRASKVGLLFQEDSFKLFRRKTFMQDACPLDLVEISSESDEEVWEVTTRKRNFVHLFLVVYWDLDEDAGVVGALRLYVLLDGLPTVALRELLPEELDEGDDDAYVDPLTEEHARHRKTYVVP
ncbi:uncharacterized protein J3R85_002012 [Psidium guajava]|nr:uncharacterized protein J3R85_002012 [Psidium guajava]